MDNKETEYNKLIDEYYNEQSNSKIETNDEFKEQMEKSLIYMDSIKEMDFPLDVNILQIISEGEQIKERKKYRLELFAFMAVCTFIVSAVAIVFGITNPKIFLYFQLLVSSILPFSIIPAARSLNKKGGI